MKLSFRQVFVENCAVAYCSRLLNEATKTSPLAKIAGIISLLKCKGGIISHPNALASTLMTLLCDESQIELLTDCDSVAVVPSVADRTFSNFVVSGNVY